MSTKSLQIRNQVIALLTAPAIPGLNTSASIAPAGVYTDWHYAIKPGDTPCIAVEMGDETPPQRVTIQMADRSMQVKVGIFTAGDDAATLADPFVVEVHRRLTADLTLGGLALDVKQDAITRQRDSTLEKPVLITEMTYLVEYRTTIASMEA